MGKGSDVPGDVLTSVAVVQREMLRLANAAYVFDGRFSNDMIEGVGVKAIRFVAPPLATGEWFVVVTAWVNGEEMVAFHRGSSFVDCAQGLFNRLNNGSLKWKADEYARQS